MNDREPLALRIPMACEALGIGRTKLYELISREQLKPIRIGRRVLILRTDLETLIERLQEQRP